MSPQATKHDVRVDLLRPGHELSQLGDEIWSLLLTVDHEYVPALSNRIDDAVSDLAARVQLWSAPIHCFEKLLRHYALVAFVDDQLAGLMSFATGVYDPQVPEWGPSTFIHLTPTYSKWREEVVPALNETILALPFDLQSPSLLRRTWSTNAAQIAVNEQYGFQDVYRIPDHRGHGIDTIYYARHAPGY